MSYCPKCGAEVREEMSFCPKCGAPLKAAPAPAETRPGEYRRHEKAEKSEKQEKGEKHEKSEFGFLGPLIGGLILIFLGIAIYIRIAGMHEETIVWASFLLLVGVIIIVAALYGAFVLTRRHPRP
jgi:uncharacterized membrane protein YvbJ